jgi:hypothetical protein
MIKSHLIVPALLLVVSASASASDPLAGTTLFPDNPSHAWRIDWGGGVVPPTAFHDAIAATDLTASDQTSPPPAVATEYSHGYQVRAKIHRYASFATLPLFATEVVLGQSLYDSPGGGKKTAHAIVGASIGSLFAVNTVTGVWNLLEARKDPVGRKKRLVHGLLMMAADAGFFATFLAAPDTEEGEFSDDRSTHRTIAITSIALATAGYLTMLLGGK